MLVFEPRPTRCRGPDEWNNWKKYSRRLRQSRLPFPVKHSPNRRPVPVAGPLQPKSSGCSEGSGELGCGFLISTTLTFFSIRTSFFFFVLVYTMSTVNYLLQKDSDKKIRAYIMDTFLKSGSLKLSERIVANRCDRLRETISVYTWLSSMALLHSLTKLGFYTMIEKVILVL